MLKNLNSPKFIIILTVFVDILGLGIVIPILPYYVQSFGVSDFVVTSLFSVFALFSFVSAPFLGALSDRIGRRPILIASITSTAIGWLIFASARAVPFLFLGRIIDGLAAGNISTAQSYLVDISKDQKERTANLGLIGAMFGIGLTVGPLIGGFLGSISHTLPFWVVGALAVVNAVLAYFRLPETHHHRDESQALDLNPVKPILRATKDKALLPGYVSWFLFGLAITIQQAVFALYIFKAFGFGEFVAGLFLTGVGITLSLNQAVLLRRFWIRKFREPDLELYMMLVLAAGSLLLIAKDLYIFILGMVLFTLSHSLLRVVMTSQMTGAAGKRQGEVMGMLMSVMSLSAILGPIVAGWLFVKDLNWPFALSAAVAVFAFGLIIFNRKKLAGKPMNEDASTGLAV